MTAQRASDNIAKWVLTVIQEQRAVYDELRKTIHHLRRQRSMRLSGKAPKSFQRLVGKGVRVPMSWSLVQTTVSTIVKTPPRFQRIPRTAKDAPAARRIARAAWPLIQTFSRMARKDLYYLSCDQLAGDGRTIWKLRRQVWEDYPLPEPGEDDKDYNRRVEEYLQSVTAQKGPPLKAGLVDPLTFMPSREEEPSFVVEIGRRPLITTLRSLGLTTNGSDIVPLAMGAPPVSEYEVPGGLSRTSEVAEVWTPDAVFVSIDGHVFQFDNEFGFIPYAWRYAMPTAIPDPVLEGTSVTFPFIGLEPWLQTLISALVAWGILGGTPILAVTTQATQGTIPGGQVAASEMPLGKRLDLPPGKGISFVPPPPVGADLIRSIELLLQFYDRAGIIPQVRGLIGSRTPGLTITTALESAQTMLISITKSLAAVLEDVVSMSLRVIDDLGLRVYITGYELSPAKGRQVLGRFYLDPKDIDGYYDIHCDITPTQLQDTVTRGMHAAFMKSHQLWSWNRAAEFSGVEDPEAERLEILKDRLRESPLYQQLALQGALQGDPELSQMVEQASATPQMAPQEGSGGTYGGAPQPRGGPSPMAGGRPAGMPRRPTGPRYRGLPQGQQFPK